MIAAAAVTDPGLLSALVGNSAAIRQQLNTALEQQSTGLVSDSYSGLGAGLQTSVNLAPAVQRNQVWQANIDQANATLGVTQSALSQIAAIATNFNAQVGAINYVGVSQVASIAASAKQALQQVADLLNTRSGDVFVFAGQDSANPPLPSTDPAVVGAALLASDTATAPFSTTLGAKTPQVEVGDGQFVSVGVLANQNTLTTSAAPTTGSYMRDIMRSLATLAPWQRDHRDLQRKRRARQRAIRPDRPQDRARGDADRIVQAGIQRPGRRHGGDADEGCGAADAIAGVIPGDRRDEEPVAGELPAGGVALPLAAPSGRRDEPPGHRAALVRVDDQAMLQRREGAAAAFRPIA
jgi:hypothetical protein